MSSGGGKFQFFQFEAAGGVPYVSCKLYHYAAGTTTDKDIWTDEAKTTTAAQPIVGDSRGIVTFYADGDYKFVLKDSADNTLYTWDNVRITSDSATMWENNHGTAYPTAAAANIWQMFAKHTAGNVLQEVGINNGSSFVPLVSIDSNLRYAADTGAANAYLIAPSPPITAYTAGQIFYMKAVNANTGASTINVNSLGIKSIKKNQGTALEANNILANQVIGLIYDGTNFELLNAIPESGTQTLTNKTLTSPTIATPTMSGNWGGGVMTSGTVKLDRLQRTEASNKNTGAITITSATNPAVSITTVDLGTVNSGDRILVVGAALFAKGGTAGNTSLALAKSSGTATISMIHDKGGTNNNLANLIVQNDPETPLSASVYLNVSAVIKVTGTGTLVLDMVGVSAGSDSTVGINAGQLYALVLNNG